MAAMVSLVINLGLFRENGHVPHLDDDFSMNHARRSQLQFCHMKIMKLVNFPPIKLSPNHN